MRHLCVPKAKNNSESQKMESGGSSNLQRKYTTRAHTSGIVTGAPTNIPTDPSNLNQQQTFKRDPDQYMPIANVIRIMRRILPAHAKIADDAKETIQECVSEFISFITSEANEKCHREYRKTITPEDVLSSMGTLGFESYIEPLTIYLKKYRAQEPEHSSMHHMSFIKRRASYLQWPAAQMAQQIPPLPFTTGYGSERLSAVEIVRPPFTMGRGPTQLPTAYAVDCGNYTELLQMNNYFMDSEGGGEGSSRDLEFDSLRQF